MFRFGCGGNGAGVVVAAAGLLAGLVVAPLAAQDLAGERWRAISRQVERDLLDGRPLRAARTARRGVADMVDLLAGGPGDGATLGGLLMLQAVADAGLGDTGAAQWTWSLAQSLDPALVTADLSRFGSAAVQLAETRLRAAAQDGQLAAEELAGRPGVFERASAAQPPREARLPDPDYPRAARAAGVQGTVILQVLLDRQGAPRFPVVLESPSPVLAYAASEAVRQGRFEPARLDGRPVAVYYDIRIDFRP
jgi:TonB family protein